jgi:hypothetical protein
MEAVAQLTDELDEALAELSSLEAEKARLQACVVVAVERVRCLIDRRASARFLQSARNRGGNLGDTLAAAEVACLLRTSERSAFRLVQQAQMLCTYHPTTLAALRDGSISWSHATTLIHEYTGVPAATALAVEAALLPVAIRTTTTKLAYQARRLRNQYHPDSIDQRARSAEARRRVEMEPDDDAMAWLSVYLPATSATAIDAHLTGVARQLQGPAERRTLAQLRTDILVDLLLPVPASGPRLGQAGPAAELRGAFGGPRARAPRASNEGHPHAGDEDEHAGEGAGENTGGAEPLTATPLPDGLRAHINVTVPVLSLLGVDDAPAQLEGYGPIPAELARRIAAHAPSFTRLLTHPETGAVLSVGRTTYAVPSDLKNWLRVRDRTCRHPGCNIPASRSELDHTTPWAHGGGTNHDNLAHLCRKHHMFKSEGLWHYEQAHPGVLTATSLAGRTYTATADDPPF